MHEEIELGKPEFCNLHRQVSGGMGFAACDEVPAITYTNSQRIMNVIISAGGVSQEVEVKPIPITIPANATIDTVSLLFRKRANWMRYRGRLTCTNKRAQADEQKMARNEGFLAPPSLHLLCICSMSVPSEFSRLQKRPRKKTASLQFPWNLLHFREREKQTSQVACSLWDRQVLQCTIHLSLQCP